MVSSDKVKVAVRVRPLNRREIELGSKCVVDMDGTQTFLHNPLHGIRDGIDGSGNPKNIPKTFAFDHCFWSITDNNPKYASQEMVFDCLGKDVLKRAFEGYNACIFAYGQTGSGKSYSMMGTNEQRGIIPRLCDALFDHIETNTDCETTFKVEVSYLEIYNEKVRDLLDPKGRPNLKVREHNILGSYVDGLSTLAVSSFHDIDNLMCEGNKSRTVAATNMNSESSRSHAVFNIILTQTLTNLQADVSGEKVSKISLVDLAGSERAQKTGAVGDRLKEGSNINKSLTTLGLVISTLADQASGKGGKAKFVPYRDSVLTWLLKDNLGGNSKTVMVATLSPSADNYEETLSTLRYADRAKRIVNHAVVNEDPNARIIRELREEVDMLRKMLSEAKQNIKPDGLQERLEESEKLMKEIGKTWEEKLNETERIHLERHAALEKMGISVQTSGIKVEQCKHYLVNLNADPCLNELLVYYLKERTLVGRPDADNAQDIQLYGLGIMPEHCLITIEGVEVFILPVEGARTCVNGKTIMKKTRVKHGDRIVWGNYHFFRLNCPKTSPSAETPENIDFDFAQQELMLQQMVGDPIQEAINSIEKQHEEDKQVALEKQRQMYERQMQKLRNQLMSPSTPSIPYSFDNFSKLTPTGSSYSTIPTKFQFWAKDREKNFRQSLQKLKEEVVRANTLVLEANKLAQELSKEVEYSVTLQIPAANLSPNRKRGAFVSEPAILVKYKNRPSQVWSMEKFENRVIDMRDYYAENKERESVCNPSSLDVFIPPERDDPFFDVHENHHLIGVANVFLEVLFYDAKLDYHVPIISQQGEVAGRLHVEISRLSGKFIETPMLDSSDANCNTFSGSFIEMSDDDGSGFSVGSYVVCKVVIKEARGLPPAVSNLVFCQYNFWGYPEIISVEPLVSEDQTSKISLENITVTFDHTKEFLFQVTEEFLEHCADGALSIEVWGHRGTELRGLPGWGIEQVHAKSRSVLDRWNELTRKIELWVEIHELNDQGEYVPVEVLQQKSEIPTGGAYQLRQGYSRRILVTIRPVQNSGTLPIICESIQQVSIGCVCARSKLQKGLDSYQEEDLNLLREKWSEALEKRREYLDEQLQKIMNKNADEKTEADIERERSLIDQWVCLAEERNAVLVPAIGSGIPGAPADWEHPLTMEQHIPVVFLDLNADDMSTPSIKEGFQAAGCNSILPKEHGAKFYPLSFARNSDKDVSVLASWDSSVHDSINLNRVTPNSERVYMILKAVVKLSHPAAMELVLRKRICVNVYKKQSLTDKIKRRIGIADMMLATGVTYEIVSNIPKASEELEDRESLAQIAASNQGTSDGESYIEKYIKGVSAVESILMLDRLRQDVAVKEILTVKGRLLRKATSVPNIYNILTSPSNSHDQIRCDSSQDVTNKTLDMDYLTNLPKHFSDIRTNDLHLHKDIHRKECCIARPNFLNLRSSIYSSPFTKPGASPAQSSSKHIKPLSTLVEEKPNQDSREDVRRSDDHYDIEEENDEDDDGDASYNLSSTVERVDASSSSSSFHQEPASQQTAHRPTSMTFLNESNDLSQSLLVSSDALPPDSPVEFHNSNFSSKFATLGMSTGFKAPPSLASSGYGGSNQAISTVTLSSEDSVSIQSSEDLLSTATEHAVNSLFLNQASGLADASNVEQNQHLVEVANQPVNAVGCDLIDAEVDDKPVEMEKNDFALSSSTGFLNGGDVQGQNQCVNNNSNNLDSDAAICNGNTEGASSSSEPNYDDSEPEKTRDLNELPTSEASAKEDEGGERSNEIKTSNSAYTEKKPIDQQQQQQTNNQNTATESHYHHQAEIDDSVSLCSFGSRADLNRFNDAPLPKWIQVEEPVFIASSFPGGQPKTGVIKFLGRTEFAPGIWVGLELDMPDGKNDGYVKGVRYFRCKSNHGVFVRHEKLSHDRKRARLARATTPGGGKQVAPSNLRRSMGNLTSVPPTPSKESRGSLGGAGVTAPPHNNSSTSTFFRATAASAAKHK